MRAEEEGLSKEKLDEYLKRLWAACARFDSSKVHQIIMEAVSDYQPSKEIYDHMWQKKEELEAFNKKLISKATNIEPLFKN
jgi:hypothetical protein